MYGDERKAGWFAASVLVKPGGAFALMIGVMTSLMYGIASAAHEKNAMLLMSD